MSEWMCVCERREDARHMRTLRRANLLLLPSSDDDGLASRLCFHVHLLLLVVLILRRLILWVAEDDASACECLG